ncbi:MAG: DUF4159 domain-containing protein [Deltaproteobacteria bacterium]|nr:DUF4159 domain-containing protein [Deltaproteobacteria bacterium]
MRRLAVALALAGISGLLLAPARRAGAIGEGSLLDLASVIYAGGNWQPRPTALRRLAWEVRKRTSIETMLEPSAIRLSAPRLFGKPMLVLSGDRGFPSWPEADVTRLRRFLVHGGFLLIDDSSDSTTDFDAAVRRELGRVLPGASLAPIPRDHVLFRTFYLLDRPVGRRTTPSDLAGIERDGRLVVVYSRLDLAGAWARDNFGNWEHEVLPGGEEQRERAFRLGVNVAMYALCLGYKADQVHVPFILGRSSRRP